VAASDRGQLTRPAGDRANRRSKLVRRIDAVRRWDADQVRRVRRGFPNAFIVQVSQGANLISNVPHNFTEAGKTVAMIVRHALDRGHREVEVEEAADEMGYDRR
jgi:hypothetical protein